MPKDERLTLWRNAIQLFHRYTNFEGPFKAAGFDRYLIETSLSTKDGILLNPDILSSSNEGWLIFELSFSQNSKKYNLEKYQNVDPRSLNIYGFKIHNSGPEIIAGRLESIDDGDFCKLIIKDKLEVENPDCLKNRILAEALTKSNGTDLSKLPQISISLLPEMVGKNGEIRRGLVDIVMQIFDPTCEGKSPIQIVDEGLDKLANITSPGKKDKLKHAVEFQMGLLISKHLKGYLEYKDGKYKATDKFKATHHSARETVSNGIREWAFSTQTTLNGYPENNPKRQTKKKRKTSN